MKRILIQNGTVYDGLGGQPYQADLLVQDGRIAQIAPGITELCLLTKTTCPNCWI